MAKEGVLTEDDDDKRVATGAAAQAEEVEIVEETAQRQEEPEQPAEEQDERLDVTGAADEADEEEHKRHRETAKERRERAKLAKERDRKELDFQRLLIKDLEQKLASVTQQTTINQAQQLQDALRMAREEEARFADVSQRAQAANNVPDAFTAERVRQEAARRAAQLEGQLQQLAQRVQAPQQPQTPAFLPYAKAFTEGKPWYDPKGRNEDSAIVLAIDQVMANEGYDPRTPTYWDELEKRVAKRLPHRYKNSDSGGDVDDDPETEQRPTQRRGPPVGGGRSAASTSPNQIRLSPERVQAMKDANIWDDEKLRKKMAIRYAEFDRNNKISARR